MIFIGEKKERTLRNFWNNCVFHPTDAVEDPWGKRILDRMSRDGAIDTVRIYAMLEDIVYLDEEGEIAYDFRISDLRLDYLVERGYNLVIAYGGIPDCIAVSNENKTSVSKNKTRYKGKMWNSMPPKDMKVWEEICYEYTKHIVERYGAETVSKWYLQCFNEPDISLFFLSHLPIDAHEERAAAYGEMYRGFVNGVTSAYEGLKIGGPAFGVHVPFLEKFLSFVRENGLRIDYITLHNYGTGPIPLLNGEEKFDVEGIISKHKLYLDIIASHGFGDREIVIDEWGMASHGFWNVEECPPFIARENEVYAAYYTKLIRRFIEVDPNISKLMICLSGQHEMTEDFSGFRNFFTLNYFAKPIYNAHLMASKLGTQLLSATGVNENLWVIPTKTENGAYSVMLTYCSKNFEEDVPRYDEYVGFEEELKGRKLRIYRIDKETANPYRVAERMGIRYPNDEEKKLLRESGKLLPITDTVYDGEPIKLKLTPNATYLIQII